MDGANAAVLFPVWGGPYDNCRSSSGPMVLLGYHRFYLFWRIDRHQQKAIPSFPPRPLARDPECGREYWLGPEFIFYRLPYRQDPEVLAVRRIS